VYRAWLSGLPDIDDDILHALKLGFSSGKNPMGMRYERCVARVEDADGRVGTEAYRYYCFVRFVSAGRDLFIADIEPAFDILPLIGQHFHARYQSQRFLIRDLSRKRAVVSDVTGWHIAELSGEGLSPVRKDGRYEHMWERYFAAIANQSRKNPRLQQKFVPLRYRKFMTEFQQEIK
jgi:probable DNA metabolism protein